jgi:hypothetical protein
MSEPGDKPFDIPKRLVEILRQSAFELLGLPGGTAGPANLLSVPTIWPRS